MPTTLPRIFSYRSHTMVGAAHPAARQKLSHKIDQGPLALARVSPRLYHSQSGLKTKQNASLIWSVAALPLGVYVIVQDLNVPLIVQPQLFALFALLSWMQCMYYGRGHSRAWCAAVLAGTLVLYAALEAGMVFALRVRPCNRVPRSPRAFR